MAVVVVAVGAVGSLWLTLNGVQRNPNLLPLTAGSKVASVPGSINLLLIGTSASGQADVVMVAHVDADRGGVALISIPGDLQVDGHPGRLDQRYAQRGAAEVVLAVETLLGVHIDHVAVTWLDGMSRLIDLLGGIEVNNPVASRNGDYNFPRGTIKLSGQEALAFVPQGDTRPEQLDRSECQRLVLQGIVTRLLSTDQLSNPAIVKGLLDQLASDVVVDSNLDARRMVELGLALRARSGAGALEALKLPIGGRGFGPNGEKVQLPDPERVESLGRALNSDTVAEWVRHR